MLGAPHPSALGIKIQYVPMCPIQAMKSSCGLSLIHRGAGRKCLPINSPGSSPQPMIVHAGHFISTPQEGQLSKSMVF